MPGYAIAGMVAIAALLAWTAACIAFTWRDRDTLNAMDKFTTAATGLVIIAVLGIASIFTAGALT